METLQNKLPSVAQLADQFRNKKLAEPENAPKSSYIDPFMVPKEKYDELKLKYDKLELKLTGFSKSNEENSNLTNTIKQLSKQNEHLKQNMYQQNSKIQQYLQQIQELEANKEKMVESRDKKLNELKSNISVKEEELTQINKLMDTHTNAFMELKGKRTNDLAQISSLKRQNERLQKNVNEMKQDICSKQEELTQLNDLMNTSLETHSKTLVQLKTKKAKYLAQIDDLNEKIEKSQRDAAKMEELLKKKEVVSVYKQEVIDKMQKELEDKTNEIASLKSALQNKQRLFEKESDELKAQRSKEIKQLIQVKNAFKNENRLLSEHLQKERQQNAESIAEIQSKDSQIIKLESEILRLKMQAVNKQVHDEEFNELKAQRSKEIKQLIQIKNEFKNDLENERKENELLKESLQKERKQNEESVAKMKSKDLQIINLKSETAKLKKQAVIQEIQFKAECKRVKKHKKKKRKRHKKRKWKKAHGATEKDKKTFKRRRLNAETPSSVRSSVPLPYDNLSTNNNPNEINSKWKKKVIGTFKIGSKEGIKSIEELHLAMDNNLVMAVLLSRSKSTLQPVPLKVAKRLIQELVNNTKNGKFSIGCAHLSCGETDHAFVDEFEISLSRLNDQKNEFCGNERDFSSLLYSMALFGGSKLLYKDIMDLIKIKQSFFEKHGYKAIAMTDFLSFTLRDKYKVTATNNNESYAHGLNVCLHDYQLQSLQWMIDEENDLFGFYRHFYKRGKFADQSIFYYSPTFDDLIVADSWPVNIAHGGFLCDGMGLGKMITILALINCNKPADMNRYSTSNNLKVESSEIRKKSLCDKSDANNPKWMEYNEEYKWYQSSATLVITSSSLVGQWEKECDERNKNKINYGRYYGERSRDIRKYIAHDIVFTTYAVLKAENGDDRSTHVLHQIYWHRIILDESHLFGDDAGIKNLRAATKWCLTDNPFQKSMKGMLDQLAFVGLPVDECEVDDRILLKIIRSMVMRHKNLQNFAPWLEEDADESTQSEDRPDNSLIHMQKELEWRLALIC